MDPTLASRIGSAKARDLPLDVPVVRHRWLFFPKTSAARSHIYLGNGTEMQKQTCQLEDLKTVKFGPPANWHHFKPVLRATNCWCTIFKQLLLRWKMTRSVSKKIACRADSHLPAKVDCSIIKIHHIPVQVSKVQPILILMILVFSLFGVVSK